MFFVLGQIVLWISDERVVNGLISKVITKGGNVDWRKIKTKEHARTCRRFGYSYGMQCKLTKGVHIKFMTFKEEAFNFVIRNDDTRYVL